MASALELLNQYDDLYFGSYIFINKRTTAPFFSIIEEYYSKLYESSVPYIAYYNFNKTDFDSITGIQDIKGIEWVITNQFIYTNQYEPLHWHAVEGIRVHEGNILILFDNKFIRLMAKEIINIEIFSKLLFDLGKFFRTSVEWRYDSQLGYLLERIKVLGNGMSSYKNAAGFGTGLEEVKKARISGAYSNIFNEEIAPEEIVAYYDDTLMLTGEKGLIVTPEIVYVSLEKLTVKIPFLEISRTPVYKEKEIGTLLITKEKEEILISFINLEYGKFIFEVVKLIYCYYKNMIKLDKPLEE